MVRGYHDEERMARIGEWLGDVPRYFLQNFTDSGDVLTEGLEGFTPGEMASLLAAVRPYIPNAQLRGV